MKLRCAMLLFLASLALVSCSIDTDPNKEPALLTQIISRGEMRVGYLVWAPAVTRDSRTGEVSGIFPTMVDEMASAVGVEVVWVETTLANFAAGLVSGDFDFSIGPTFTTIPRAAAVAFTQPVAFVGNSAVVRADGAFRPDSLAEVNRAGVRVAVLQGQALSEFAKREFPEAEIVVLSGGNLTAPLLAVSSGQADIGFMNSVTVSLYAAAHPEVIQVFATQQVEVLPLSWATRHGEQDLLNFLNNSITYLSANGKIATAQNQQAIPLLYDDLALKPTGE